MKIYLLMFVNIVKFYFQENKKNVKINDKANPFQMHKKRVKKAIIEIGRDLTFKLFQSNVLVSPGQKLCYFCKKKKKKYRIKSEYY